MTQPRRAAALALLALPLMAQAPQQPPARLANPSAEFCVQRLRGTYENERTAAGERGICVLRDGRRMDAWALFRAYNRDQPADQQGQGEPEEALPPGGPHLME